MSYREHTMTLDAKTLAEIARVAATAGAARVKVTTTDDDEIVDVWWHEADDVTWRQLRGPWNAHGLDAVQPKGLAR